MSTPSPPTTLVPVAPSTATSPARDTATSAKPKWNGGTLRPWQKGQSGNPSGLSKADRILDQLWGKDAKEAAIDLQVLLTGTPEERRERFGEAVRVSAETRARYLWQVFSRRNRLPKDEAGGGDTAIQVNLLVPIP